MRLLVLMALLAIANLQTSTALMQPIVPRVSFWCGKVNQHVDMVSGEWLTDEDGVSGCVDPTDKVAVVQYCKKTYPYMRITNAMQDQERTISSWCERGNVNCEFESSRPTFICFAGHFEAPRLEVPNGCHFTHLYEAHHCKNEDHWLTAAQEQCRTAGHSLHSRGMLVPCGREVYRGVEFVCCPTEEREATSVPETESTVTASPSYHPLVHHTVFSARECSQGAFHNQYRSMLEQMDGQQRHRLRGIVGQYRRQKGAADQLEEREPEAARLMMGRVRQAVRSRVEAAEKEISREHHGLKAAYRRQLVRCYEQKLCTAIQMFAAVLSEDREQAARIVEEVTLIIRHQMMMQYKKVQTESRISDADTGASRRAQPAMKHFGRRLDHDLNFTRSFLMLAARMLRGVDIQLHDCSLVQSEATSPGLHASETPAIPDFGLILEPGPVVFEPGPVVIEPVITDTEAPEASKPSPAVPEIPIIWGPGPVLIEPEETESPQPTEQPVTRIEPKPTEDHEPEVHEPVVDVGKGKPNRHHQHDHDNHRNGMVDGAHEAPIHHQPEHHKEAISNEIPVFVTDGPEESIDDNEHVDENTSPTRTYLGVAVGLAAGAALLALAFLVAFAIRRHRNGPRVETSIADDERSVHEMEADLQDHGFVNPTYKLFDEMEDNQ